MRKVYSNIHLDIEFNEEQVEFEYSVNIKKINVFNYYFTHSPHVYVRKRLRRIIPPIILSCISVFIH